MFPIDTNEESLASHAYRKFPLSFSAGVWDSPQQANLAASQIQCLVDSIIRLFAVKTILTNNKYQSSQLGFVL